MKLHLCLLAGLFLCLGIYYFPCLTGQKIFYIADINFFFAPLCRYIGHSLATGRLPLWNPYVFCGSPQIAIGSPGIFYPPNWFYGLGSFSQVVAWSLVLHQLLAASGTYLAMSAFGMSGIAAIVASIIYAMSGYMFGLEYNYTLPETACWIPICLYLVKITDSKLSLANCRRLTLASLAIFMLVAAGRPEVYLPALVLLLCYSFGSLVSAFNEKNRDLKSGFSQFLLRVSSLIIGLLLASPAIVPLLEWKGLSMRAQALSVQEIFLWSANWYDMLGIILAQPLGDLCRIDNHFLRLVGTFPGNIPYLSTAYVGPVAITLAIWGAFDKTWRYRFLILLSLIVGLLLTAGNQTPVMPTVLHIFPGLAVFRFPVKFMIFPLAALAILSGRGAFVLSAKTPNRIATYFCIILWLGFLIFGIAASVLANTNLVGSYSKFFLTDPQTLAQAGILFGAASIVAAFSGLIILLAARFYIQDKISELALCSILVIGLAATLLIPAFSYNRHLAAPDFESRTSYLNYAIKYLESKEQDQNAHSHYSLNNFRVLALPMNLDCCPEPYIHLVQQTPAPSYPLSQLDPTQVLFEYGRQLLLPNTNMDYAIASSSGYEFAETADYKRIYMQALEQSHAGLYGNDHLLARFCQITNTKYVFSQIQLNAPFPLLDNKEFELLREDSSMNIRIYRLRQSCARAYICKSWTFGKPEQETQDVFFDCSKANSDAEVNLVENSPEHISIHVRSKSPGLLVLADRFYPGWQAFIDSRPAKIYRANSLTRACTVPEGVHLVDFVYRPRSLAIGLNFALAAILFLAFLFVAAFFKSKQASTLL